MIAPPQSIPVDSADIHCYVYRLEECDPVTEELTNGDSSEASAVPAATHWLLPSTEFDSLWDTLYYDSDVKNQVR